MEKRKRPIRKIVTGVLAAVCALIVIYVGTTAWLTGAPLNPSVLANLEDFAVSADVFFMDGATRVNATPQPDGTFVVSPTAGVSNYIGNLRVNVTLEGSGACYVRARLTYEWLVTPPNPATPYRLPGNTEIPFGFNDSIWFDNRNSDYCFYYIGVPNEGTINLIESGFNASTFDVSFVPQYGSTLQLKIGVEVEAVQFNRYKQIWGFTSLPWRS